MQKMVLEFQNVSKVFKERYLGSGSLKSWFFRPDQNVKKKVTGVHALKDISFKIHEGETIGVLGKNGCGKSTLLGLVAKVLQPTTGKIIVNRRVAPLLELGGGFHPDLNASENILLNGVLLGMSLKEVQEISPKIIEFAELEDFMNSPIRMFSSGMLARLGFSIVAFSKPEILIVDEVLSVGDQSFRQKCHRTIDEFRENGVTILFVSHDTNEILRICTRCLVIVEGNIVFDGDVSEAITAYHKSLNLL